jgi:hypothetical protein
MKRTTRLFFFLRDSCQAFPVAYAKGFVVLREKAHFLARELAPAAVVADRVG